MVTSHAIILRTRDHGEAHRIYTLYTRDYGKINALATGVRKSGSKFAGHLTEESILSCTLHPGQDRARLIHAERMRSFPALRRDLTRYAVAHAAREALEVMTREGVADPIPFSLLERLFVRLGARAADPQLLLRAYLHHLLAALGHRAVPARIRRRAPIAFLLGDHLDRPLESVKFLEAIVRA